MKTSRFTPPLLGCILAGGHSSRMGRDKALLPFQGRPLIAHALELLRAAGCDPVIAGSRPDLEAYAPVLPDLHPGCGPLSGIESALSSLSTSHCDAVLFLPIDLPLMPVSFLGLLLERSAQTGALATVPFLGGRPQPLCAVYRTALLPGIAAALDAGEYKVMRVLESLAPRCKRDFFCTEAVLAACGNLGLSTPAHRWFANINTPAEWAELQQTGASMTVTVDTPPRSFAAPPRIH